ncbi:MAG: AAA family ATPase [Armatimonadota bacterium]|nr:AAA family ATPase [Armatimonadota bacterium]MDR7519254.1 AAA family ATPase [Armatimonadota bacterium]MDR7550903.1 AAA family ATPase [Armatimonadota bacterium]
MARLQIRLLGRFSAATEAGPVDIQMASARLVAYLALAGDRPISRAQVAGSLWPDLPEERARANLSTVVWRLRSELAARGFPHELIFATETSLELNKAWCDVDVDQFRLQALTSGVRSYSLEMLSKAVRAVQLYRGDLLEDWDLEWCGLEREELRRCYFTTLRSLAEAFEHRGRLDYALRYARQATNVDPLDEPAQRALIRLLFLTGDKASAVNQFNKFARLVRSELGTEPDEETLTLFHELLSSSRTRRFSYGVQTGRALSVRTEKVPLLGRLEPRRQLSAFLDAAYAGSGGGFLLLGEAGIGKSRLAEWAMEEWAARGAPSVRGRCLEFNEPVPYQPLLDALAAYVEAADLTRFFDGGDSALSAFRLGDGESDREPGRRSQPVAWPLGKLRLFSWLRRRLEEVSRSRPLLMVLEDLQWADAGTLDFLTYLLEGASTMPLAVVLTSRPTHRPMKSQFDPQRVGRYCSGTVHLGPLSREETFQLVRSLVEDWQISHDVADWLYRETEGNPLFVIETLRLLQQQDKFESLARGRLFDPERGDDPVVSFEIPDGVRSAVRQRLDMLDAASLRIAEIASVLGRSVDEELLAMVSGTGPNRLSRAIAHLLRVGVFEREKAGYRFSHDKIRAVCYESLPARARRIYHARAAAALVQMPEVPAQRLAWHQTCAGQWHLASATWKAAGDNAREVHAYEEALRAYRHAILCVRRDTSRNVRERNAEEVELLAQIDGVLAITGRPVERRMVLEQMAALCRRSGHARGRALWLVRSALLKEHETDFTGALRLAREAWSVARDESDRPMEVEALRVVAWALNRFGRHRRSLAVSMLALKKAENGPSLTKAAVLVEAATVFIKLSDYLSAMSYLESAKRVLVGLGYTDDHPRILIAEGIVHKWSGNLALSRAHLEKAMRSADQVQDVVAVAKAAAQLATVDSLEGRLGIALRTLRRAIVTSRSAGYCRGQISCLNEIANGIGRLVGNYAWAWDASSRALRLARLGGNDLLTAVCKDTQAQLLVEEGRLEEALFEVGEALQLLSRMHGSIGPSQESLARRGAILLQLGNLPQAIADLECARRTQTETGDRLVLVDTLTYLALAYAKLGDADRGLATSEEALRLLEQIGFANYQPQRVFWHHYLILEMLDREPRLDYLRRAVEFIEAQASTLSRAQAWRLRTRVPLNCEILAAWEQHSQAPDSERRRAEPQAVQAVGLL